MKTLVDTHVTLVMSQLIVPQELVRVTGAGVALMPCVEEVSSMSRLS